MGKFFFHQYVIVISIRMNCNLSILCNDYVQLKENMMIADDTIPICSQ